MKLKLDDVLSKIKNVELELKYLEIGRDSTQAKISDMNDELKGIKDKMLFKEDELKKLYASMKEIIRNND